MGKATNVPESYFHCPALSKRERAYLIKKAQESAKALVEGARSANGPIRWMEAGSHNGVKMYKGEARENQGFVSGGEEVNFVCGATSMQATLEEVAEFFDVSTTPKMKAFAASQDDLHDGVVLYTLAHPNAANQFMHQITVKWMLANIPAPLKDRDFLTLECQDVFTDSTGRRGWVRSYHSVKLPCCPDLQDDLGCVRGSMYHSGYVFVESERPGWLDAIYSIQVNFKGSVYLPTSLYVFMMKRRIGSVAMLGRTLLERRLGKQRFLGDLELVPKSHRSRCVLCSVRFGMLTRKTRCRKCGEVVCHACTQVWDIMLPNYGSTKKVRVCSRCTAATADGVEIDYKEHGTESISIGSERASATHSPNEMPRARPQQLSMQEEAYRRNQNRSIEFEQPYDPRRRATRHASFEEDARHYAPRSGEFDNRRAQPHQYQAAPVRAPQVRPPGYDYGHGRMVPPPPPPPPRRDPRYYDDYSADEDDFDDDGYSYAAPPPPAQARDPRYAPQPPYQNKLRYTHDSDETLSSASDYSIGGAPSLTASALENHTRQMGHQGPASHTPVPTPAYQRPPSHERQTQSYGRRPVQEEQAAVWRAPQREPYYSRSSASFYEAPVNRSFHRRPDQPPRSSSSREDAHSAGGSSQQSHELGGNYTRSSQQLQRPHPAPLQTPGLSFSSDQPRPGSFSDDKNGSIDDDGKSFDETSMYSPVSRAISETFSQLLHSDDRLTADSYRFSVTSSMMEPSISFCDTVQDDDDVVPSKQEVARASRIETVEEDDDGTVVSGPTVSSSRTSHSSSEKNSRNSLDEKKLSVVQLYQHILELTKQQHALDTNPHADPQQKDLVADELRALYQKLNALTMSPETEV